MLSRRAARLSGSARPVALRGVAFQAVLLIVLLGAWPAAVSASSPAPLSSAVPSSAAGSGSVPAAAASQVRPTSRVVCPPAAHGMMSCLSLIRTDIAPLARGAVGAFLSPSGYNPTDLRSAYTLPAPGSGAGSGITVAIVDAYDLATAEADLAVYRSQFGLSACTTANQCFRKVDQNGGTSYPPTNAGWGTETALDIEMVSAICPNCHILLVEADSSFTNDLGTAVNTAVTLGASVVSNSYGGPEDFSDLSIDSLYFNHPGVAITVSSGDSGFGVQFPASSPHVTAVGGTSLTRPGGVWTETAWSGAGSGCSIVQPKPAWQADGSCAKRTNTDVSAVADPHTGVAVYQGSWLVAGGTSVAAPIIAGVYALAGKPTAGSYPASYPYAHVSQLHDVTSGSNGSCGGTYLCTGKAGYDGPTGLGTPNGVGAFVSPFLPGAPTAVTGVAGNASALVSWHAAIGNGHPVTGYTVTSTPGGFTCTTAGTLSCTVSGLTNGTSYTFKVTATNSLGTGPASAASGAVIPATVPGAPTGVAGTVADGSVALTWSAPASNGGRSVTGYIATSSPLGKTCTTAGTLGCTVLGLTNGTPYTFTVKATNAMGTGSASSASTSVTPVTIPGATYVVVTPNRIVDTRSVQSQLIGPLTANKARTFQVTGTSTPLNIPSSAIAVTGNLTVTGQTAAGYFSLTQTAINNPTTSTLNFPLGDNRANGVTVALSDTGTLSVTYAAVAGNTAHVLFDITGYFVPNATGATYLTVIPTRIVNSRTNVGLTNGPLTANTARTFQVTGTSTPLNIPSSAIAVTGNLTVTGQTAAGYFSLTQTAINNPTTSTLNFPLGDNRANGVTVPLGIGGILGITYVAAAGNTAQAVFDVTGYFVNDASGATYVVVTPNRIVDTRSAQGLTAGRLVANFAQTFSVPGRSADPLKDIPADAISVTGNLTVTGPTAAGFLSLTLAPINNPTTSTLNFPLGDNRANGVTVALSGSGTLSVTYVATGGASTHVLFDVTGYFVP